jgi:hypothetical protein
MKRSRETITAFVLVALVIIAFSFQGLTSEDAPQTELFSPFDRVIRENAQRMIQEGRRVFRFDTFGDEAFWGDTLKLHQAITGVKLGGVGPGLSPNAALAMGLKVDVDALPQNILSDLKAGRLDLDDSATTVALLKLNAVVGLTGFSTIRAA